MSNLTISAFTINQLQDKYLSNIDKISLLYPYFKLKLLKSYKSRYINYKGFIFQIYCKIDYIGFIVSLFVDIGINPKISTHTSKSYIYLNSYQVRFLSAIISQFSTNIESRLNNIFALLSH